MKSVVIIEGSTVYALFFFIFLLMVQQIRIFFSLKPSASQGESSLKGNTQLIQLGNKQQTHTLTF